MKRRTIILIIAAATVFCAVVTVALLFYTGVLLFNSPSTERYPVRGIDVSHYQGKIDWEIIAEQNIDFAYIKATEGSSLVDERFEYNYASAISAGLRAGAYHFFSFDSAGASQAENFIATVNAYDGMLPPAVDVELYGGYTSSPPSDIDSVKRELHTMLEALTAHYGVRPVIYATSHSYKLFISGSFDEYDIWIRDVFSPPSLPDGREWTFWQYTNRGRLYGFSGDEKYIDLNVFYGTADAFSEYGK